MRDDWSWEALIDRPIVMGPHWDIVFVSEADGVCGHKEILTIRGCHIEQWWPGPGGFAMAFVIHPGLRPFVRKLH